MNVDFDDAHVTLSVKGLKIFDDHDQANSFTSGLGLPGDPRFPFPRIAPVLPVRATVSFEAEWSGRLNAAVIEILSKGSRDRSSKRERPSTGPLSRTASVSNRSNPTLRASFSP